MATKLALVALLLTCAASAAAAAANKAPAAAPAAPVDARSTIVCPAHCLSCERIRSKLTPKYVASRTLMQVESRTAPLRTQW